MEKCILNADIEANSLSQKWNQGDMYFFKNLHFLDQFILTSTYSKD